MIVKKEVMKVAFLQFLSLKDIFRLSMACKKFREVIDPVAVKCQSNFGSNKQRINCAHLKRIAAIHLLDNINDEYIDYRFVDQTFGIDLQQIKQFSHLDG